MAKRFILPGQQTKKQRKKEKLKEREPQNEPKREAKKVLRREEKYSKPTLKIRLRKPGERDSQDQKKGGLSLSEIGQEGRESTGQQSSGNEGYGRDSGVADKERKRERRERRGIPKTDPVDDSADELEGDVQSNGKDARGGEEEAGKRGSGDTPERVRERTKQEAHFASNPKVAAQSKEVYGEEVGEETSREKEVGGKEEEEAVEDKEKYQEDIPPSRTQSDNAESTAIPAPEVSINLSQKRRLSVFSDHMATDEEIKKFKLTPGVHCSICAIGTECPEFKEGYVCAYDPAFESFPARGVNEVLGLMRHLFEVNKKRLFRAIHSEEQVNGGEVMDKVDRLMGIVRAQALELIELDRESQEATITFKGTAPEETRQATGGILQRLFGGSKENNTTQVVGATLTELEAMTPPAQNPDDVPIQSLEEDD